MMPIKYIIKHHKYPYRQSKKTNQEQYPTKLPTFAIHQKAMKRSKKTFTISNKYVTPCGFDPSLQY